MLIQCMRNTRDMLHTGLCTPHIPDMSCDYLQGLPVAIVRSITTVHSPTESCMPITEYDDDSHPFTL